ncbi:hypothetical protein NPIL_304441 [Nephila pilipes]|uniref:Uncharacterized protein n=1 Tax=Nephila pilipes TaxID=299642 RepID=A0A8X6UG76_NEPPI|nr:hypothetical protein NPIL_304441 [Nephila pilipes]
MRSEGSTESSNNHERQRQSKRRPPVRRNWQKRSAPSSLVSNTEVKRRHHGSCKWRKRSIPVSLPSGPGTRKMTRREAADEKTSIWRVQIRILAFDICSIRITSRYVMILIHYWCQFIQWSLKNRQNLQQINKQPL